MQLQYFSDIPNKQHSYCDGGVMVSIVAFQAIDPGSIPGHRRVYFFILLIFIFLFKYIISSFPLLSFCLNNNISTAMGV